MKKQADGPHASFAHAGQDGFKPGERMLLYDTQWHEQGEGVIASKDRIKGFVRFSPEKPPRYGWLVALARGQEE